jgi:phosphoribosylanthranilate isomerase
VFKVKVCGITNARDAQMAVALGADMIGIIVYKGSPRFVSRESVADILKVVPATVDKVLVAVGNEIAPFVRVAQRFGFEFVQWYGPLTKAEVRSARALGVRIIIAVSNPTGSKLKPAAKTGASLILVDNADSSGDGGTGKRFDWSRKLPATIRNIVLAGGINSGNVAEGVQRFRPLVVDVNSGVESKPGIKSVKKLKQFFHVCDVIRYGTKA